MDQVITLHNAQDENEALEAFKALKESITKTYPKVITLLENNKSLYSFYAFPKEIQRCLYTTNLVEGLNKQLKRQTKKKEQFPNEESLERFVCDYMLSCNSKFSIRDHKGFNLVQSEIEKLFEKTYH